MQSCNTFLPEPKIRTDAHCPDMPFTLMNDIRYKSNVIDGKIIRIYVNKKFRWNGSDIPRVFWRLIGSRYDVAFLPASLIHDFSVNNKHKYTNKQASIIFRDILTIYGVNRFKANVMAFCVYCWQQLPINKGWKK